MSAYAYQEGVSLVLAVLPRHHVLLRRLQAGDQRTAPGRAMPENGPGRARVKPKLAIAARSSGRSITARPPLPRQSRLMRPMQLTPKGFGRQRDRKGQPRDTAAWESSSGPERRDPMKIDIDRMTEAELIDLNHRIVARLRFLNQMRAHSEMLEFRIGDRVAFRPSGQGRVEGLLTRYNKKGSHGV